MNSKGYSKNNPNFILEIAQRNPIVNGHVQAWRNGYMNWEQCLIGCVSALHERVEELEAVTTEIVDNAPSHLYLEAKEYYRVHGNEQVLDYLEKLEAIQAGPLFVSKFRLAELQKKKDSQEN